ncbi:hypothetical protein BURMUCGD2M_1771 [Burkholderia multivorans CGD2M]|uniref:Uncharacterized protein n=1 Tax=Burkholderia multivorans CGD2 TaxID=513052 RepID=B9BXV2_9BURK|nr:hypothetical protein BURMUCGD2_1680 [Burkholderia multivorans CGD2]EEE14583.1 hypothetical protein BURMUCGD2M_1771 [Burkholderia multivorans CGD2M]
MPSRFFVKIPAHRYRAARIGAILGLSWTRKRACTRAFLSVAKGLAQVRTMRLKPRV